MNRSRIVMSGVLVAMAGCVAPVHQVEETYPTVSFNHHVGYEHEADYKAQRHCAEKYGLDAVVVHRTPERSIYECSHESARHPRHR